MLMDINSKHLGRSQYRGQHKNNCLGTEQRIAPERLHIAIHLTPNGAIYSLSDSNAIIPDTLIPKYILRNEVRHGAGDDGDVGDQYPVVEDTPDPVGADDGEHDVEDAADA